VAIDVLEAAFYSSMLRRAQLCHSVTSVCPSFCQPMTFRYHDHTRGIVGK